MTSAAAAGLEPLGQYSPPATQPTALGHARSPRRRPEAPAGSGTVEIDQPDDCSRSTAEAGEWLEPDATPLPTATQVACKGQTIEDGTTCSAPKATEGTGIVPARQAGGVAPAASATVGGTAARTSAATAATSPAASALPLSIGGS